MLKESNVMKNSMQYSYRPSSYPGDTGGRGLNGVDVHSVGGIMYNGRPLYPLIQGYSEQLKVQQNFRTIP